MFTRLAALSLFASSAVYPASSALCGTCHQAIYESYSRTAMANSSGIAGQSPALETFQNSEFSNALSGFLYRVSRDAAGYFFEFRNTAGITGRKSIPYFIGSGAAARSYLIADDGFLFQAPVTYYKAGAKWELAPNYGQYAYPYLTRPATGSCLICHAGLLQPVAGTLNRYEARPFLESGISCERCHGSGEEHIASGGSIVNPASLPPDRRDSICAQCHLSGEVRVVRAGAKWDSYRPGDRLSDHVAVFVRQDNSRMAVTSHAENLAHSACKRVSGDRLWCGTCHDPHKEPSAQESAAWFKKKCLGCHDLSACKASPAARSSRDDRCTECHMPKAAVTDAQHVVFTDHSIPRQPRSTPVRQSSSLELAAMGSGPVDERDLAIAYASVASRQPNAQDQARARRMLEAAAARSPGDVDVLVYLAEIYRNTGMDERAIPLYRRAIELDPSQLTAPVGLGSIEFQRGQYAESIRLWKDALSKNAGLELVRTNLSMAQWRSGDLAGAEASLVKAIELSPAFQPAKDLLKQLRDAARVTEMPRP